MRAGNGRPAHLIAGQKMYSGATFEAEFKLYEQRFLWETAFASADNEVAPTAFTADAVAATNTITAPSGLDVFRVGDLVAMNGLVVASAENYKVALVTAASATSLALDPEYITLADETTLSLTIWRPRSYYPSICGESATIEVSTNKYSSYLLGARLDGFNLTGEAEGATAITVNAGIIAVDGGITDTPADGPRVLTGAITPPIAEEPNSMQITSPGTAGSAPGIELLVLGGTAYTLGAAGLPLRSLGVSYDLPKSAPVSTTADHLVKGLVEADKGGGVTFSLGAHMDSTVQPLLDALQATERIDVTIVFCNGTSKTAIRIPNAGLTSGLPGPDGDTWTAAISARGADGPGGLPALDVYVFYNLFNQI